MVPFARHVDQLGFESLYVVEHVVVPVRYEQRYPYSETGRMPLPPDCPIPDPLDLLAFLAACTRTIRLATGVLVAPHHHPLVLAKRLATIDRLSGGRVMAGLGVGWMREELDATGVDFATRGRRVDETMAAMRALWAQSGSAEGASFDGEFFSFREVRSEPGPVRPEGVPLHVGGHSEAAARRCGRLGDGLHPLGLDESELSRRWSLARQVAESVGRDPDALELSITVGLSALTDETVDRAERLGVHRIVCSTAGSDLEAVLDGLSAVAVEQGLVPQEPA
jgi:probable F420-dependent oxidoreductase